MEGRGECGEDAGYQGVEKRAENRDMDVEWRVGDETWTASETEGGELRGLGGEEQIIHQG